MHTESAQTSIPNRLSLLGLPPELRDRIYVTTFSGSRDTGRRNGRNTPAPGLLLTCKCIYNEAIGAFYHCSTFTFCYLHSLMGWLAAIPEICLTEISDIVFDRRGLFSDGYYDHLAADDAAVSVVFLLRKSPIAGQLRRLEEGALTVRIR
jgi:hypothetical protein